MTANLDRYLSKLTADAEIFGLCGQDYPYSFYKVFVRPDGARKWWRFENQAGPSTIDPISAQQAVPICARATIVWGRLACFRDYAVHPERPSLVALKARAAELLAETLQR